MGRLSIRAFRRIRAVSRRPQILLIFFFELTFQIDWVIQDMFKGGQVQTGCFQNSAYIIKCLSMREFCTCYFLLWIYVLFDQALAHQSLCCGGCNVPKEFVVHDVNVKYHALITIDTWNLVIPWMRMCLGSLLGMWSTNCTTHFRGEGNPNSQLWSHPTFRFCRRRFHYY